MTKESVEEVRALELSLLQSEEVYRQILDAIADMVLVKGAHSRILWGNKSFREYYGMSNEQLQELVDAPFNKPDNTQQYVADDLLVFTTGKTLEIPREVVTRYDGTVNLFHTVKSAIRGEDGRVRMTVGVSRNIGETLELREELIRSREQLERDRLSTFASQLPGFLFQLRLVNSSGQDGSLRFTFVSSRFHEYYGTVPSDLAKSPGKFYDHIEEPARVRDELETALRDAGDHNASVHHVHRVCGADGVYRWMELLARPQIEADGSVTFHGYVHDITARHQIELEREALVSKLTTSNKEMEQFTYTISHDLKSPLVTIRGFLDGIEEDIRAGKHDRALSDIARIRAAADKMSRMLAELLDLSRIGRIGHNPTNLRIGDVIAEARELLTARLAGVEVTVSGDDSRVWADRARLVQVFQNLLENGVKYRGTHASPRIHIECGTDASGTHIHVSDNGMGIAAAHFKRIFGLFEKLDARSEGTGVGLALVKSVVELHRGQVRVESEGAEKGSTFHLFFPARA